MREHRNPRKRLSKRSKPSNPPVELPEPEPADDDVDCLMHVLRENIRRADSFVTSAEKELLVSWGVGDDGGGEDDEGDSVQRLRNRVEDLVEAAKFAVRAAGYTTGQLAAELDRHRRGA